MPISNFRTRSGFVAAALAISVSVGSALAFDPEKTFKPDEEPRTVLRYGYKALKNGNFEEALGAFRWGAKKNDVAAQWKLARMLQRGDGVKRDDIAAFNLYARIANRYSERAPLAHDTAYVSSSVVALGLYSLTGIRNTNIVANIRDAEDHFYRAAALYKDPEAQYQLGKLYRSGLLGRKQARSAARWFGLASRKGHPGATAQLGEMLFYGEGVRKSPVRGLVYMARAAAAKARDGSLKSIRRMQRKAFSRASPEQRDAAAQIIANSKPVTAQRTRSFALDSLMGGQGD